MANSKRRATEEHGTEAPGENPLVPNRALRSMRAIVLRLRAMEPTRAGISKGRPSLRGTEAVRAASLLSLREGDLICNQAGSLPDEQLKALWSAAGVEGAAPRQIEAEPDERLRLLLGMGAAAGLKVTSRSSLLLLMARAESRSKAEWAEVLGLAGRLELPVIVCVLPAAAGVRAGELSAGSQRFGVPGIPVDAADPVALYRVMQECVQRVRGGDGPALLEAVTWTGPKSARSRRDAVAMLEELLRARGESIARS